jgi:hypothetical protein
MSKKHFLVEVESSERTEWIDDDAAFMEIMRKRIEGMTLYFTAGPLPQITVTQHPDGSPTGKGGRHDDH